MRSTQRENGMLPSTRLSYRAAAQHMLDLAARAASMSTSVSLHCADIALHDTYQPRTETKAISVFPVKDILAVIPPILHPSIRMSPYYTAGSDSLTFQAQTHRSRTANADENRQKLAAVIAELYDEKVPAETGSDKHAKYKEVYVCWSDFGLGAY